MVFATKERQERVRRPGAAGRAAIGTCRSKRAFAPRDRHPAGMREIDAPPRALGPKREIGVRVAPPATARRLRNPLVEAGPVEAQQHPLLFGVARPAASGPARHFRGQDLRPPLALPPPYVALELVVIDQLESASRSILLRASASSGVLLVRSRTYPQSIRSGYRSASRRVQRPSSSLFRWIQARRRFPIAGV